MDKFFIYLLESGICLTLFYLGYVFLFRKETYFMFNRIYLLLSVILSVGIPMVHFGFNLKPEAPLAKQMTNITKFKYTYEKLISLTDPDFVMPEIIQHKSKLEKSAKENNNIFLVTLKKPKEFWFRVIIGVYVIGLVFFLIRFVYLLFWLYHYSRKLEKSSFDGIRMLQVPDKFPSFSFFNNVFINKNVLTPAEFEQVIAHEKVHVRQNHSIDLLIAHGVAIFQWYNPLVWRIQRSMKTIHEYLADREVLKQGFELFDYQSLLLSQLISIRSVELVNNFNLLSIKKRIAMMNKIKSGFIAKLKALFAIPIITVVFLLFANFTFDQSDLVISDEKPVELTGSWKSMEKDDSFTQMIEFKGEKLVIITSVAENSLNIDDYALKIRNNTLILNSDKKNLKVKYELSGDRIRIWWDKNTIVEYIKMPEHFSLMVVGRDFIDENLPKIDSPHKFDAAKIQIRIIFDRKNFYINDKKCSGQDFEKVLRSVKEKCTESEKNITATLDINADTKMKDVDMILSVLRNNNILKIGYLADPVDKHKYKASLYGIARLLPPKDLVLIDPAELGRKGIKLYKMDISENVPDIQIIKSELKNFIKSSKEYMMDLVYSNNTSYNIFIRFNDMVNTVFAEVRNEYAQSVYSKDFENLSEEKQNEIKLIYPMTLTTEIN